MLWTQILSPSQVAYVNSIIDQIPEANGARTAFVDILQNLADKAAPPKWRYYFVIDGEVTGSNDYEVAEHFIDEIVIDTLDGTCDTMNVREIEKPVDEDDETEDLED